MKPDGTHTVAELAEIARTELQSWERIELAHELADMSELLKSCTMEDIWNHTPYYVYEEEPDDRSEDEVIEEASTYDLIRELINRGEQEEMLDHMDIEEDIIPYLEDKGYEVRE